MCERAAPDVILWTVSGVRMWKTASDKSFKWKASTSATDLELILKSHKEQFTVEESTPFKATVVTQMCEQAENTPSQMLIEVCEAFQKSINKNLKSNPKGPI